nr:MAG TPA: hypothetical protein [Caudoviricetes sp.]
MLRISLSVFLSLAPSFQDTNATSVSITHTYHFRKILFE